MSAKQIKRVIVTGAGFSAPAKLPIQNRIIDRMTDGSELDFMSGKIPQESYKFLDAYITVGLFLLDNYGKKDYHAYEEEYSRILDTTKALEIFENIKRQKNVGRKFGQGFDAAIPDWPTEYDRYAWYYILRDNVRKAIKDEQINANLEDIFTSFDKSVLGQEYLHKYTYRRMDSIRYSIVRLFAYYFSKGVLDHSYEQSDYLNFISYVKARRSKSPLTIITTNWDTLMEQYFERMRLQFNYGFQSTYTSEDYAAKNEKNNEMLLLKLHGSANWLKCLHCGSISVYRDNAAAESLFDDRKQEACTICGSFSNKNDTSLQPEMITPSMMKALTNRLYLNLWGTAARELRNATHLIFVGYSFPIADFEFRYMLQRNISKNAQIDVVLYENDDPRQTDNAYLRSMLPEKRYRDAFPKNQIHFFYDGFGKYFAKMV